MGVSVNVGYLAWLVENDIEGANWLRDSFQSVNEVLTKKRLPPHVEPERLPTLYNRASLNGFPYSELHKVRRVAAYAAEYPGWMAVPFPETSSAATDPLIETHSGMRSHLLCHSDCEGFYLPIDFDEVIIDDEGRIPGGMLGSSFSLMRELISIAPALRIHAMDGSLSDQDAQLINDEAEAEAALWMEKAVWLCLFEAARLSIQHRTAICFS